MSDAEALERCIAVGGVAVFPADTFFPQWDRARFALVAHEPHETADGLRYAFATYQKLRTGE